MNVGSLNEFLDFEGQTYQKIPLSTKQRAISHKERKVEKKENKPTRAIEIQILRSNIQRYNEQLQAIFKSRKKKKIQKSLIVEKPQTVKRPQLAAIQIKSPNFLGLFDKSKIFEDQISIQRYEYQQQRLKQKHHLLRTIHDVKQEQNKDKINSLLDQVYGRMQDEFNNQSQTRSQERQQYIQKYETLQKVWHGVAKDTKNAPETIMNSGESSDEEVTQTPRKLKKVQQNQVKNKADPKKIILQFPQKRWSRLRNMSYQQESENRQKNERIELNSGKFIEQIIETGKSKKQTGDVIDKLDKIVNQIFE